MIIIKNLRFSKPQFAWQVRVDRASVLGNPYYMENETQRDKVCDLYGAYFEENMQDTNSAFYQEIQRLYGILDWLLENNRQIVITGTVPTAAIANLAPRIKAQIDGGIACAIAECDA